MSSAKAPSETASDFNAAIISIAVSADREAFAALYQHFAPRLRNYLIRLGTPANLAEELAQETMLAVWRKARMFDPARAGASTWIFTIARNLRIDLQRRARTAAASVESDPSDEPDSPPGVEASLIAEERDDQVRMALSRLSPEQADVVRLCYFQDKPHSEVARALGLPLGTVKSRARLALARLRTLLEDLK